jgi:hypothetical protein
MNDDTLKAAREFRRQQYPNWTSEAAEKAGCFPRPLFDEVLADFCDSRTAELRRQLEDAEKFIDVFADGTCHEATHDSIGSECGCAYTRVRETALAYRTKYPKGGEKCRVCGTASGSMWGEICNNCRKEENERA